MLDIKFIRNNPEIVRKTIQSKNINLDLDKLLALDARRRELIESSETLKAEQNRKSKGKQFNIEELKVLKDKIKINIFVWNFFFYYFRIVADKFNVEHGLIILLYFYPILVLKFTPHPLKKTLSFFSFSLTRS